MKLTKKDWLRINKILRERNIANDQFKHINCIRMHPTESDAHFEEKVRICRQFFKAGKPFLTECWTVDGKRRFDVIDLLDNIVYEIETGKSYSKQNDVEEVKI